MEEGTEENRGLLNQTREPRRGTSDSRERTRVIRRIP